MANKKFTPEEMSELRKSKYVLDVSPSIVHFSAEFKEEFWNGLMQGKLPKDIVQSLGINPKILGEIRLGGLKTMVRNEVKKGDGFRDLNTYMQAGNGYMSAENRIKYLEMQLAYKEQVRYLLDSIQNEKNLTWSAQMRELLREMIHYRNSLDPEEDLAPIKVEVFEERFGQILDIADREYEYEPPSKYYMDGFNLKERLREFKEAHLLFLHDKNVPADNNLAERLLRIFKRKQRQVMSFRSFKSLEYLCQSLTMLSHLCNAEANLYESVSRIFA